MCVLFWFLKLKIIIFRENNACGNCLIRKCENMPHHWEKKDPFPYIRIIFSFFCLLQGFSCLSFHCLIVMEQKLCHVVRLKAKTKKDEFWRDTFLVSSSSFILLFHLSKINVPSISHFFNSVIPLITIPI